jgi:hypothetical protein
MLLRDLLQDFVCAAAGVTQFTAMSSAAVSLPRLLVSAMTPA